MIGRSQGYLAASACVLAFGACTAPTEHTDLRPDGPPEVLTVLVSDDTDGAGIVETATFCKIGDDKRPGLVPSNPDGPVQVCSDDLSKGVRDDSDSADADEVTDTSPVDWYVRLQFDELLNPNIEDLLPIKDPQGNDTGLKKGTLANTRPVTLTCGGLNIPYDGYYDPSGNAFTWPLGPSLFVAPNDSSKIATGTECEILLNDDVIVDKDGEHVPVDQLGPYKFRIAPLALIATDPAPVKDVTKVDTIQKIDPGKPLVLTFNATIDVTSLDATEVTMLEVAQCTDTTGTTQAAVVGAHKKDMDTIDKQSIEIRDSAATGMDAWERSKTYLITFPAGAAVKDVAGGSGVIAPLPGATDLTICFRTAM